MGRAGGKTAASATSRTCTITRVPTCSRSCRTASRCSANSAGSGLPLEDHLWWNKRNWGYRTFEDRAKLQTGYEGLIEKLEPLVKQGLAAAIYTQTTDVEGEVNGLLTYDRKVVKFDAAKLGGHASPPDLTGFHQIT